jgi:hypothetical protein
MRAARMIGISTTAMKKACRRLDVNRWPYSSRTTTAQMSAKRNVSVGEKKIIKINKTKLKQESLALQLANNHRADECNV